MFRAITLVVLIISAIAGLTTVAPAAYPLKQVQNTEVGPPAPNAPGTLPGR